MALPKHPGLLQLEDIFIENGAVYEVTKPIQVGSLDRFLQKSRTHFLTESEVKYSALMIFDAVAALHEGGYIHGSINTRHLLIGIKLGDFKLVLHGVYHNFGKT